MAFAPFTIYKTLVIHRINSKSFKVKQLIRL